MSETTGATQLGAGGDDVHRPAGWCFPAPYDAQIDWRRIGAVAAIVAAVCIVWAAVSWWNLSPDSHAGRGPARTTLKLNIDAQNRLDATAVQGRAIASDAKPQPYRSSQQAWGVYTFDVSAAERRHARTLRVSLHVVGALKGRLGSAKGASVRVATAHARITRDKGGAWLVDRLGHDESVQVLVVVPVDEAPAAAPRLQTVTAAFDTRIRRAAGRADDRSLLGNHVFLWGIGALAFAVLLPLLVWWRMRARLLVRTHRAGMAAESRARRGRDHEGMPAVMPAAIAAQMTLGAVDMRGGPVLAATLIDLVMSDVVRARRVDSVGRSGGVQLSMPGDMRGLGQMQRAVIDLLLTADPDAARDVEHEVQAPVDAIVDTGDAGEPDASAAPDIEVRSTCFLPDPGARLVHRLSRVSPTGLMAARYRVHGAVRYAVAAQAGVRRVPRWMLEQVTRAAIIVAVVVVVAAALFAPGVSAAAYWVALIAIAVAGGALVWTVPARRLVWWRWVARASIDQRAAWVAWLRVTSERLDGQIPIDPRARGWAVGIGRSDAVPVKTINGAVGLDAITEPSVRACSVIADLD